jgi:fucose 4-O-acetylase-like acetyltransferase
MNRQYGALSGVAIFMIALNHAIHFGLQVSPAEGAWFKVLVVFQALGSFAVPVFFFVSGAFLAYAAREFSGVFVRSSLERILWPYIIWSGIFYAFLYVATDVAYPLTGYLKSLVVGYPYHFVPLLVFWYLATPLVVWIGRSHGTLLLTAIGAWQAWLLAVRFPSMFGVQAWMPAWAGATLPPVLSTTMSEWGLYFPLGLVMSLHGAALKPRLVQWRSVAATATVVLFGLGLLNAFGLMDAPWARLAAPVPLMFVLPALDRRSIPWFESFEKLGRRSYAIYLIHFIVLNAFVVAVGESSWGALSALVFPIFLVAALAVPLLLMDVMARTTAGRRVYRYLFGIVPPAALQQRVT